MSMEDFKRRVLAEPGAREAIDEIKAQMLADQLLYRARQKTKRPRSEVSQGDAS